MQGITVTLYEKAKTGIDEFGVEIYETTPTKICDVIVAPASSDDIVNNLTLAGSKVVYQLALPKGDNHNWHDTDVEFFGEKFHTFGEPIEGIEDLIPLRWNKKVWVERYEQV